MDFDYSDKCKNMLGRLDAFMREHIYPNENAYADEIATGDRWAPLRLIEDPKIKA